MKCYTVGHTNYKLKQFGAMLKNYGVNCIVDVRSTPYSKFVPQFDRANLKDYLNRENIYYIFMGDELGARRKDDELYFEDGQVDFAKVSQTELFGRGIERLIDGMNKGYSIALMCTEKDAFDCHRFNLVSKALSERGIEVIHIYNDNEFVKTEHLEKRLINMYCEEFDQVDLFSKIDFDGTALEYGYYRRNKDIGYRKDDDE